LPDCRNDLDPPFATMTNCRVAKLSWMEKFGDWKHADSVVGWTGPESTVAWSFRALRAARYYLELDYSSRSQADGTEGIVAVGGEEFPFPVLDTGERAEAVPNHGNWPQFRTYRLGVADLARPGRYTLLVRPAQAVGPEWIKLRRVSFLPVPP
jgi:alpha-L-fucosidase